MDEVIPAIDYDIDITVEGEQGIEVQMSDSQEVNISVHGDYSEEKGERGEKGEKGDNGADGISPTVSLEDVAGGTRVIVTDKDGDHVFDVMNGADGAKGDKGDKGDKGETGAKGEQGETGATGATGAKGDKGDKGDDGEAGKDGVDGFSPVVESTQITGGTKVSITDATHTETFDVMNGHDGAQGAKGDNGADGKDGKDGQDGQDGVSPSITTDTITGGTRVTITDATGAHVFDVMNGANGQDGHDGQDGAKGATGNGIASVTQNADYTLTITFTDGTSYTTTSIRGAQGEQGQQGTDGEDGKSAYQYAVDGGYTGTEADFTAKMAQEIPPEMTILSYGHSTWADFIAAYTTRTIVYCRASSNSNPATGSQTRMAFMAYVNNANNPTEVEFQYYRSVSSHSDSQQGDQVYVYKLNKSSGWSVTVRNTFTKIDVGTGLSKVWANGVLTISLSS